jgi:hypothetical protein
MVINVNIVARVAACTVVEVDRRFRGAYRLHHQSCGGSTHALKFAHNQENGTRCEKGRSWKHERRSSTMFWN